MRCRPSFWQNLLRSGAPGRKVAAGARNCLAATADLERVDVSAAARRMSAGDAFGPACDFPALAWLPAELSKDDLLVHRLAVPYNPWLEPTTYTCPNCGVADEPCQCPEGDLHG